MPETIRAILADLPPLTHGQGWVAVAAAAALVLLWLLTLWLRRGRTLATAEARASGLRDELQIQRRASEEAARDVDERDRLLDRAGAEIEAGQVALREERSAGEAKADALSQALTAERAALAALRAEAAARAEADAARIDEMKALRQEMSDRFAALSDEALKAQGQRFETSSAQRLQQLLGPMKAGVDKFQEELRHANDAAKRERVALKTEIEGLSRRSAEVSDQALALTNALKGDKQKQGAWGEAQLARLLEAAHLTEGLHFETQASARAEDGRLLRPDVIVHMPNERPLVIDSKVSLIAYEEAVNAVEDGARAMAVKAHVRAVREHIETLTGKSYHRLAVEGVDYTVMFVPIEGALAMAVEAQPDLAAWALERGVALATPLTLMALLRTVEHVWAVDDRQKNAMEIANRAGRLYDKVAGFVEDAKKVGRALETATKAHGDAMTKLSEGSGNVLAQTEMLKTLGARAQKAIEAEFEAEGRREAERGQLAVGK